MGKGVPGIQKLEARSLYLKSKIYRFFAAIFALVGLVVFGVIYFQYSGGNFLKAIMDPFIVIIVFFPFVPAIILSFVAVRAEKKLEKFFEQTSDAKDKSA